MRISCFKNNLFVRFNFQRTKHIFSFVWSIVKCYYYVHMKGIKPNEFFKQVSINSGIPDLDLVKRLYYGMVRTITRELRGKQTIKLPDLGEFYIKIHKARKFYDVTSNSMSMIEAKPTIKFDADYKLKEYFYSLAKPDNPQ